MVYHDEFTGWYDVQQNFDIKEPEPFRVLYAGYEYECYEGSADVLWRNEDGTFGYVSGGHCSCYGLEGQWDPETYTVEQVKGQLERANYGFFRDHADIVRAELEAAS